MSLEQAVHDVVARTRRRSGREINVVAHTPTTVALRSAQFERVLSNLVDNTLKFCPTSQAIEINNKHISDVNHQRRQPSATQTSRMFSAVSIARRLPGRHPAPDLS